MIGNRLHSSCVALAAFVGIKPAPYADTGARGDDKIFWKDSGQLLLARLGARHGWCAQSTGRRCVLALSLVLLSLFMFTTPALAAIAVDNTSSQAGGLGNQTSLTWSHTVGSGSNRILIVGVSLRQGNTSVSSVTYGASGLTLIGAETNGNGNVRVELWKLVNPSTGTADITVTLVEARRIVGGAVSFTGVDQVAPHGAFASAGTKSASPSVAVSSASGELVVDALATRGDANGVNVGASQSQRWNAQTTDGPPGDRAWGAGSTEAGAASVTMSWTLTASREWALGAVALKPALATVDLSGTVFEDVNYGGGAGRSLASSGGSGRSGAAVELYNALGVFVTSTTTNTSGVYTFAGQPGSVAYTVRVVNSTVTSSRGGYVAGLLPVQTFRTNGLSGNVGVADATRVGGEQPNLVDAGVGAAGTTMNTSTGAFAAGLTGQQAQSISTFTAGTSNVTGIDFGFNFDTIVATRDSGQGSLRQFILNAAYLSGETSLAQTGSRLNGLTGSTEALPSGKENSIFMIPDGMTHPGLRSGLASGLTSGVAQIAPTTALPSIGATNTLIDGGTQSFNVGNTNSGTLGAGGTVGIDALSLPTVQCPEVRIQDGGGIAIGLNLEGSTLTVRGIAIYGFGNSANNDNNANIRIGSNWTGTVIEQNVIGTAGTSFTDPGSGVRTGGDNIRSVGGDNGIIRNNLIGFAEGKGIGLEATSTGWQVLANESRGNGINNHNLDGIDIENVSGNTTVAGNLFAANQGVGVDSYASAGSNAIRNNTVIGNGIGTSTAVETPGVRLYGANNTVDRNIISGNFGAGVMVTVNSGANQITRNSIFNNGASSGEIGIDLQATADNASTGTTPFVTLNDSGDGDTGANGLLNYPVMLGAVISGGNLTLSGYARPGAVIELFKAAADPSGFGEGQTHLTAFTEGSAQDTDATTGTYGPAAVNNVAQGADTTNRFRFTIATPAGVAVGTALAATATVGAATSEFSGNVTAVTPFALTSQKALQVVSDPVNVTTNPKAIPGAFVAYTVTVNNPAGGTVDAHTVVITDAIPAKADLFVGNIGAAGSGPVAFINGSPSSGLGYTFTSLASTTDDVSFSNNGGTSFVYTPTPGAGGVDSAVTHIRINPKGTFNGNSSFQVTFRVRVE